MYNKIRKSKAHCSYGISHHSYLFPRPETQVAALISACLTNISQWISAHYLKFSLDKTELLFPPGKASPIFDLCSSDHKESWGDTEWPTAPIAGMTSSCRFILHKIRRTLSILPRGQHRFWSILFVISLLAGSPASPDPCSSSRMLQLVWSTCQGSPSLHLLSAPSGCSNPMQVTGTCLLCCKWLRPNLHPGHCQTIDPKVSHHTHSPKSVFSLTKNQNSF